MTKGTATINVYLDDGRVFSYDVPAIKGREHAYQIATSGYRHCEDDCVEYYPVHRILKVKVTGDIGTLYPDRVRGT